MESSVQDNLTTRSLLKGILATEAICPPVGNRTQKSVSCTPVSLMHQEKTVASPSISLQSQMKERVRHSLGKLALENSSVKKNVTAKTRRNCEKTFFPSVVEELDKITPRTLMKKIIQNEDDVSIVVSQGSKAAHEDQIRQRNTCNKRPSSLSNVNLSLPDFQDTEHLKVFRNTRKKRRMDASQFEREVDGKMLINKDNTIYLDEESSLENVNLSRSFQNPLTFSTEPQSTYKKALLRKPIKAFLVSLGDFEQGVEDKYRLVKGSQDCFIESVIEDKSSTSASKVAELNTELYLHPLTAQNSEKKLKHKSKNLALSHKPKNEEEIRLLETDTEDIRITDPLKPMGQSMETYEIIVEDADLFETTRSIQKIVPENEDPELSKQNRSLQNNEFGGTDFKNVQADKNLPNFVVKNISHIAPNRKLKEFRSSEPNQHTQISMSKGDQTSLNYFAVGENVGSFHNAHSLEKSSSLKKDANQSKATRHIWESELADENGSLFKSDDGKHDFLFEVKNNVEDVLPRSSVAEDKHEINRISHMNSKVNEENEKQYSKNCVRVPSSRQEDNVDSLQGDHLESTMDDEVLSNQENVNKQPVLSALIDTPTYIRNARFTILCNKPDVDKKVRKIKTLKKSKGVATFKGSLVKQIFVLHSKIRVSKEAFADVETCLEEYLDQLTGDLAAYTSHANRKTITGADFELLMKRQHLVTNTTSLNLLIERHLPLEYRKLLIPCAMSGNKVFPCLAKILPEK